MRNSKICAAVLSLLLCFTAVTAEEPPYSEENFPEVTSDYVCLYDTANAQLLYGERMEEMMYPASMTKIMTAVLAIEALMISKRPYISNRGCGTG